MRDDPVQRIGQGGFPRGRRARDADERSLWNVQVHIMYRALRMLAIAKTEIS